MKGTLILTALILTTASLTPAQQDRPQSTPVTPNSELPIDEAVRRSSELNRRSEALRMTQNLPPKVPDSKRKEFIQMIEPLYRRSTEEERAFMAPAEDVAAPYSGFADGKNSGIFTIVEDRGCNSNPKVVNASVDCSRYSMPGAGSAYSFRFGDYRMLHIADIVFSKGNFEALGVLNHGIMVDLGDVPFESVTEKTDGVDYLTDLKPSKNFQKAAELADNLKKGIKKNDRIYASILPVREGSTYVIRSIAYDGEVLRNLGGIVYNELEMDRRRDVLVAFHVIRLSDGRAAIVWRELEDEKPPKLKADK